MEYCYTKLTIDLLLRRAENSAEGWGGIPNNRIEGWNTSLWYVVCGMCKCLMFLRLLTLIYELKVAFADCVIELLMGSSRCPDIQ